MPQRRKILTSEKEMHDTQQTQGLVGITYRPNGEVCFGIQAASTERLTHYSINTVLRVLLRHSDVHFSNIHLSSSCLLLFLLFFYIRNVLTVCLTISFGKIRYSIMPKTHEKTHFTITSLLLWKSTFDINKNVCSS